jgi:hypothetical protein
VFGEQEEETGAPAPPTTGPAERWLKTLAVIPGRGEAANPESRIQQTLITHLDSGQPRYTRLPE